MLEKPTLSDESLLSGLKNEFGLAALRLDFLPLGADLNTAVYRAETAAGEAYFVKLRKGNFEKASLALPDWLNRQGVPGIIPPLLTLQGKLWGRLGSYRLILYTFIEGQDAYEQPPSQQQWIALGALLKALHSLLPPAALRRTIRREDYSPAGRQSVAAFLELAQGSSFSDPLSAEMAGVLRTRRRQIERMLERAGALGLELQRRHDLAYVVCHTDVHPGNLHLGLDGGLYLVDWDNPRLAPKERDLMFLGAGMGEHDPGDVETACFYQGYGAAEINQEALAYYRYERILQDISEFSKQILLTSGDGEDRFQAYEWFCGQFLPGHEVEAAFASDPLRPD